MDSDEIIAIQPQPKNHFRCVVQYIQPHLGNIHVFFNIDSNSTTPVNGKVEMFQNAYS